MAANKYIALVAGKLKEVVASVTSVANAIVAMDATGRIDSSILPIGVGVEAISCLASENLAAGAFVNFFLSGGVIKARNADNTNTSKPAHGFVNSAVLSGASATVFSISGINTGVTGLTIGTEYWLGTTGGLVSTPPSTTGNLSQFIGIASKTTEIGFINTQTVEIS